jgi:sensor c-di-GMP phosphodiesterase-like protein
MECLICKDSGEEPLQDNTACPCKYKRHISCWIDYIHSRPKTSCPLCRTDLSVKAKYTPKVPYTPQLRTIPEERSREERLIQITQSYQNEAVIEVQQPQQQFQKKVSKFLTSVLCAALITAIIVLVIIVF